MVSLAVGLIAVLSRPAITKALRGLLANGKELELFALSLLVAVGLVAVLLAVFGPSIAGAIMLAFIALFAMWAIRPPAKRG